jgi:hypothetical protein
MYKSGDVCTDIHGFADEKLQLCLAIMSAESNFLKICRVMEDLQNA